MRRISEPSEHDLVVVPGRVIPGSRSSRRSTPWPWGEAWWAALSLMVLILVLVAGQAFLLVRRYGATPAVEMVNGTVSPSSGLLAGATVVEMAAFGDSAMAGVGVHDVNDSLPVQLAQRVADATGRLVHVVSYARPGARTVDVLTRQIPQVRHTPDVSVLVVGTNDVTAVTAPATLARSSNVLLDGLVSLGAPVVMSSLPEFRAMKLLPHPLMEAVLGYGAVVGAVQQHAAAQTPGVHLVDVRATVGSEFFAEGNMSADSFHPSAVGYGRIADAMVPAILSALRTPTQEECP